VSLPPLPKAEGEQATSPLGRWLPNQDPEDSDSIKDSDSEFSNGRDYHESVRKVRKRHLQDGAYRKRKYFLCGRGIPDKLTKVAGVENTRYFVPEISHPVEICHADLSRYNISGLKPMDCVHEVVLEAKHPVTGKMRLCLSKSEKNLLYSLKPKDYLLAASDPALPVKVRSLLKTEEHFFLTVYDSWIAVRDKMLVTGEFLSPLLRELIILAHRIKSRFKWTLRDQLELRYVKYILHDLNEVKLRLDLIGLNKSDLYNPLIKGSLKVGLRRSRLQNASI